MGAHSAPLGLSFAIVPGLAGPYGPGALVGVHGSWNRNPPRAPEVSFFPWRDGTLAAPADPARPASRTTTAPAGADRSWPCRARTGPCTSATTRLAPSTGCRHPDPPPGGVASPR